MSQPTDVSGRERGTGPVESVEADCGGVRVVGSVVDGRVDRGRQEEPGVEGDGEVQVTGGSGVVNTTRGPSKTPVEVPDV